MTSATIATEIGDIEIELYDESAPKAAANIETLARKGYYDDVPVEKALVFEAALCAYLKSKYAALMANLEKTKDLSADDEKALTAAVEDFKKNGAY